MNRTAAGLDDGILFLDLLGFGLGCLGLVLATLIIVFPKLRSHRPTNVILFGFTLTLIGFGTYQVTQTALIQSPDWAKPLANAIQLVILTAVAVATVGYNWHRGRVALIALFLVSLVTALSAGWGVIQASEANDLTRLNLVEVPNPPWKSVAHARTDHGTEIPLYASLAPKMPLRAAEQTDLATRLARQVIETAPESLCTNCHGWTFTGGKYHVESGDVPKILCDNGYQPTNRPRQGDVIVYHHEVDGTVVHTGVVRSVGFDGLILVESKWGATGARYVHEPKMQPYSTQFQYYRSRRFGHYLRGLNSLPVSVEPQTARQAGPRTVEQGAPADAKMAE